MNNDNLKETQKLHETAQELTKMLQYCSSSHLHKGDDKEAQDIEYQLERIGHLMTIIVCEVSALKRILNHEKEPKLDKIRRYRHVESSSENQ